MKTAHRNRLKEGTLQTLLKLKINSNKELFEACLLLAATDWLDENKRRSACSGHTISYVTWMVVGASIRARDVVTWMNVVKWGFPLESFRDKTQDEELLGRNRGSIIRIPKQLVEIFREHSKTAISVIWLGSATGQTQPLRLLYTTLQLVRMVDKDWPNQQEKVLKVKLWPTDILGIFDFSENFKCKNQREVQSAYYSHDSITVYPILAYYKCTECLEYVKYTDAYANNPVTAATFYRCRPRNVKYKVRVKYVGCLCEYSEKLQLKIEAINCIKPGTFKETYELSHDVPEIYRMGIRPPGVHCTNMRQVWNTQT